jgi:hypothetical protein
MPMETTSASADNPSNNASFVPILRWLRVFLLRDTAEMQGDERVNIRNR